MLRPMGLPEDVSVIAWGLSLERPAMIRFECSNIRELLGDKVNLNTVRDAEVIHFVWLNNFISFKSTIKVF